MKKFLVPFLLITGTLVLSSCTNQSTSKDTKPKNIILMIGDGMGIAEVSAAMTVNGGSLSMLEVSSFGYSRTSSASDYVTDSGAGGTAISTGTRTYNGAIGVDSDTLPLKTILEFAEEKGLSSGLISTSAVTHATPASFIAHQKSRNYYEAIAADFLKTDVDVVIGGGRDHFSKRADSVDLISVLVQNGYQVADSLAAIDAENAGKFYVLTAPVHNPRVSEGRGGLLPEATDLALRVLNRNEKGFFVMVEGSMIDWGGHAHDAQYIIEETLDFDQAVGKALEFARADGETLVLITADHETGGMALNGGDLAGRSVTAGFTTTGHTAVMVPVFAYGPGAEKFTGVQDNTDLFEKMMELLSLNEGSGR